MRFAIATAPAKPDEPNEDFAAGAPNGVAGLSGTASKCIHGVATSPAVAGQPMV